MRIFRHDTVAAAERGAVVAIGNFDGVHLGHQAVIGEAGRIARGEGLPHAVLTFEPHPRRVFHPDDPPFRLTPFRAKSRHIEALGVDLLFTLHFDPAFARRSAADFIEGVLVGNLGVRHAVVGYDFVFGHHRGGTPASLQARGA
ncbi:MAG TPA: riboflavin biosynthesis protein RibF, partial [Stellaceae bacterium]